MESVVLMELEASWRKLGFKIPKYVNVCLFFILLVTMSRWISEKAIISMGFIDIHIEVTPTHENKNWKYVGENGQSVSYCASV